MRLLKYLDLKPLFQDHSRWESLAKMTNLKRRKSSTAAADSPQQLFSSLQEYSKRSSGSLTFITIFSQLSQVSSQLFWLPQWISQPTWSLTVRNILHLLRNKQLRYLYVLILPCTTILNGVFILLLHYSSHLQQLLLGIFNLL